MAIEKTAKIVAALADVGNFVDAVLADDKINWSDTVHLPRLAALIPATIGAVTNFSELRDEIKSLDESSRSQLVELFKNQFDISEDNIEKIVEQAIEILSYSKDVIEKIVAFSKAVKK